VVKHWAGYGAEPEGFDGHNYYGRILRHDDASLALHVAAFRGALAVPAAGVMPTYGIISGAMQKGKPFPQVGGGFSRPLLTDLLRGTYRFDGLIVSDWAITNDCPAACLSPTEQQQQLPQAIGMPWGVEKLTQVERYALGVNAGIDQFGGVDDPAPLLAAVRAGRITPQRVDQSVRRVLLNKFRLGLFDDPYVDAEAAARIVGDAAAQREADSAQRRAQVILENRGDLLPLRTPNVKAWLHNIDPSAARAAGLTVVQDPAAADVAIVRTATPSEKLHPWHFFGSRQNEGRLDLRDGDPDYEAIKRAAALVPTIVAIDMDRPAILTNVREHARAIVVAFGASDAAVLDVLTGRARAEGRLPFELPSSMAEVERQNPALPDDTAHPLYKRGAGMTLRTK
jgi:beta-glucosidase